MNRTFSLLSLLSITSVVTAGCGGSDDSSNTSPITDPPVVNDGGTCNWECSAISMSKLCGRGHTTLVKDGLAPDDAANGVIQGALIANCVPPPRAAALEKGAPGLIDPATGRPMAGSDHLLTVAGGAFVQKTVAYLDTIAATGVYFVANETSRSWQYVSRATGAVVAELPRDSFSTTHDLLLIEFVRDPTSGTPVLIAFGQEPESTTAAAWYVANEIIPKRSSYDKTWYAYEWTASAAPGATPTYALKATSP